METKANYIVIGAFTFAVAIAAVLFGLFAARYATESAWNNYQILFEESVIGLSDGSPVLYNGVNVGRVTDLKLNPEDVREVIVTVEIGAKVPIHEDTVASVRLTGLTGTAAIQLSGGSPESPLLTNDEDQPERIEAVSSPLNRLLESSEGIIVTANKALNQIDAVLSDANIQRVDATLASLERFSGSVADPDSSLNRLLDNASEASAALPALVERLSSTVQRFDETVAGVDTGLIDDLPELRSRMTGALANIESLSGRLDTIVASNQEELAQLGGVGMNQFTGGVEEIRRLVRDLSELVRRVERDPARFLLGGEQPEEYPSQ
ncbi:MAG: MCE family protein [Wenzhouxiangellaceae bacterium]|nr:MCE family protein [Wenzhouxiangellaceae bacterium]MBS3824741.1 MCE family protein [Wenzhouxiangellaceae bacterium]